MFFLGIEIVAEIQEQAIVRLLFIFVVDIDVVFSEIVQMRKVKGVVKWMNEGGIWIADAWIVEV